MRAAIYERTGPAREVLGVAEVPTPMPGPGEVRVRVQWSGVNPSDVKSRAGLRTRALAFPRIIPHSDGAGIIDEVGSGVSRARIGERVWLWNAAWKRAFGTAAEYVALPAAQAVLLPDATPPEAGACLGIPAMTACHAIRVDGGVAGKTVLVAGGAGAVGHYAIQFARLAGARQILATVSSPGKAAVARSAGADIVLDYRTEDLLAKTMEATGGQGVDRIVEVNYSGNAAIDIELLKPEGDIVAYGSNAAEVAVPFFPMILKNARVRYFIVYQLDPESRECAVREMTAALDAGRLKHHIAERLPLARIAEAHELVELGRAVGNVVLSVDG